MKIASQLSVRRMKQMSVVVPDGGCPWEEKTLLTTMKAGGSNVLDVLRWARDTARAPPCPWCGTGAGLHVFGRPVRGFV